MKVKIQSIVILSALYALVCLSGCAETVHPDKKVLWHQQYEPMEDVSLVSKAHEILAEAERLLGKPTLPVRNIHIRRSVARKNPVLLSRADIVSWERLCDRISSLKTEEIPGRELDSFLIELRNISEKGVCKKKSNLDYKEKTEIIDELNRLIFSGNFRRGDGRRFFRQNAGERRAALHRIFPESVLPTPASIYKTTGFELIEILDESEGSFVVYVEPAREDPLFFFKLSHEICHLVNPYVYDWYVEGLCNLFAEHMTKKEGIEIGEFRDSTSRLGDRDPYSASYLMTRAVKETAGEDVWRLFQFAVPSGAEEKKMRIDIDSWLYTLSPEKRREVKNIIRRWSGPLKRINIKNNFTVPK